MTFLRVEPGRSPLVRYGTAIIAAVLAALARLALAPALGDNLPLITFLVAILAASWIGGLGPGLLATLTSTAFAAYLFGPIQSLRMTLPTGGGALIAFAVLGALISVISGSLHGGRRRERDAREHAQRAFAVDITAMKKAEQAIRESEIRKAAILASALDAIIAMDHHGRIVDFNPAAEQLFGHRRDDVLGQTVADTIVPPRLRDSHRAGLRRYLETGESRQLARRIEMPALRADGSEFSAELTISVVHLRDNEPFFTAYLRDITERKRVEDAERLARADAEAANRLKDEFLATVSHELRTPLNVILGWTVTLERAAENDAAVARALQSISRNTRMLAQLVDDVLDVSRMISGKMRLETVSMDLAEVIEAAVETVQPASTAKHIAIAVDIEPAARSLVGDPTRLQQVIWNLLSNAVKFTPCDGHVDVSARAHEDSIEITVTDTGIGIDASFLPYVFDRFRQADASTTRTQSGLGLGLAIVRHLVELHGGTVQAFSAGRNTGTRVVIQLPARIPVVLEARG